MSNPIFILTIKVVNFLQFSVYCQLFCYCFILDLIKEATRMDKLKIKQHLTAKRMVKKIPLCVPFACVPLSFSQSLLLNIFNSHLRINSCLLLISYQNFKSMFGTKYFSSQSNISKNLQSKRTSYQYFMTPFLSLCYHCDIRSLVNFVRVCQDYSCKSAKWKVYKKKR